MNIEDFQFDEYSGAAGSQSGVKNDNQYSFSPIVINGGISNIETDVTGNNYAGVHKLATGTTSNNTGGITDPNSYPDENKIKKHQ